MGTLRDRLDAVSGAPTAAPSLIDRLSALVAPGQPSDAASLGIPEGATLIATFDDNGRIYEMPDGRRGAVSAGGSTTDPATVERLLEGATFAETTQDSVDTQRIAENPIAARGLEFVRGTPFIGSYADEAVGLFSPEAAENMRRTSDAMGRQNPYETGALSALGTVVGAIPMAIAAAPAVSTGAPLSLGGRVLAGAGAGAASGAVEGAVYGYGEGETPDERAAAARQGAGWGAGAGAVFGMALPAATALGRAAYQRFNQGSERAIGNALAISQDAAGEIRNALASEDMIEAVAALRRAGPGAMLADATPGLASLLDAAIATPSAASRIARRAIGERTRQAARDLTGTLDSTLGLPRGEREILDTINDSTKGQRRGAYDAAYASPINYADAPGMQIEALLDRLPPGAIEEANRIMRLRGDQSEQIMARVEDLPNGRQRTTYVRMPDVRQLHYILQALDDLGQGSAAVNQFGRPNTYGNAVRGLRRELSEALRDAAPLFGKAQDVAADTIRRQEAARLGATMFQRDVTREDVIRALAGASADEKAAMREGIRSQIDEAMARVRRVATDGDVESRQAMQVLRDLSSEDARTKLRVLLGQAEADRLMAQVGEAEVAFALRAAVHENSKTAVRQNAQRGIQERAQGGVLRALLRLEPINFGRAIGQVLTGESKDAVRLREMGIYEEIATALTQIRGQQAQQALRVIERAMQGAPVSMAQARLVSGALTAGGVLAGSRLANQRLAPR